MIKAYTIGLGGRGKLYSNIIQGSGLARMAGICDTDTRNFGYAQKYLGLSREECFEDYRRLLERVNREDLVIIATQDEQHCEHALAAIERGCTILLEKPVSNKWEDCVRMERAAKEAGVKVLVCHVLRYTPFYDTIKKIIDSGRLGKPVTISQTEGVGYWHQAHSFVRGNWRRDDRSPMILQKCCHDLDILAYLMGKDCNSVSSYGENSFFKSENAPEGSADYCFECAKRESCPYDCIRFYKKEKDWRPMAGYYGPDDEKEVERWLSDRSVPYARCVFHCDNNVVDHQVVDLSFVGGGTAQLTMTAFSKDCDRTVRVHCTYGEIEGNMNSRMVTVRPFCGEEEKIDLEKIASDFSGHGGGDVQMIRDVLSLMSGGASLARMTFLDRSVLSHRMAFAAERSRLNAGSPVTL